MTTPVGAESRANTPVAWRVWLGQAAQRPALRWSDIWRAPLHDFPIRDEILYQSLPISQALDLLEVGPGSGFTALRLARQVRSITLLDAAPEVIERLRTDLGCLQNVRLVADDVARPGLATRLRQDFDAIYALDVLEYVVDPAVGLANMASVLGKKGELLLTFPNVPPPVGDGVTYFPRRAQLEELLAGAGFSDWILLSARLQPWASQLYTACHDWPLRLYRRLRRRVVEERPQTYEATWAFRHGWRLKRYRAALHAAWFLLDRALRLGGDVFALEPAGDDIVGLQLVVRARR